MNYQTKNMYIDSHIQHDIKYFKFKAKEEKFNMMKIFKGLDKVEDLRLQKKECNNVCKQDESGENNHAHFHNQKEQEYQDEKNRVEEEMLKIEREI